MPGDPCDPFGRQGASHRGRALDLATVPPFVLDPAKFFTEPHYNGFPAVLVRLSAVTARELKPIITEAWRCQAPKDLDTKHKTSRRRGRDSA